MSKQARIVMNSDRVPHTLTVDAAVGDILEAGTMVAVAGSGGTVGDEITVYTAGVVVEADIAATEAVSFGTQLYFAGGQLTTTAGSVLAGKCITNKPAGTAGTIQFILNG